MTATTNADVANATQVAQRYLAAWNETGAERRRGLIAEAFAADASYLDPLMQGQGHDGINAMIGAAQAHFPGHRFSLSGTPESHHDRIRFSWALAAEGAAPVARGTDFATLSADGRLQGVTGFLDQAPGA
ncbi:MAG TPA: nuclear transport factor 2 family protein [Burkholderiaceae bacterium]|nr:nuclear transport factor 2 family protein [Burkholderiaceae bacterium]